MLPIISYPLFQKRDKNKELEARNRELEKKLLEEKNLRENAESKLIQMKNKMAEMKKFLATLKVESKAALNGQDATPACGSTSDSTGPSVFMEQRDTKGSTAKLEISPKKYSSSDNIISMALAINDDHTGVEDARTHRKTASLFFPTLSSDGTSRRRSNSIGDIDSDVISSSAGLPAGNTVVKPSGVQKNVRRRPMCALPCLQNSAEIVTKLIHLRLVI